jgi:hypothetical protein
MAFQSKQFFFHKYGPSGMNIVVREGGSPTGPIIAETCLDDAAFQGLLEELGVTRYEELPEIDVDLEVDGDEIDLRLYADSNGNGVPDEEEQT